MVEEILRYHMQFQTKTSFKYILKIEIIDIHSTSIQYFVIVSAGFFCCWHNCYWYSIFCVWLLGCLSFALYLIPGINVPRSRFLPVKTSSDLLISMSNLYHLKTGTLEMNPKRSFPSVPLVKLGTNFNKVTQSQLLMVRWVVGSILHGLDPLSYFSFQPVLHDWCNKGCGMCYPVCGMVHIKEPLLLIRKSSPCGGSRFPLSLSEWSLTICLTPYNRN